MKTRVWELAKELEISTKELLDIAKQNGLVINNPLRSLESEQEQNIRQWHKQYVMTGAQTTPADAATQQTLVPEPQVENKTVAQLPAVERPPEAVVTTSLALPAVAAPTQDAITTKPVEVAPVAVKQAQENIVISAALSPVATKQPEPVVSKPAEIAQTAPGQPQELPAAKPVTQAAPVVADKDIAAPKQATPIVVQPVVQPKEQKEIAGIKSSAPQTPAVTDKTSEAFVAKPVEAVTKEDKALPGRSPEPEAKKDDRKVSPVAVAVVKPSASTAVEPHADTPKLQAKTGPKEVPVAPHHNHTDSGKPQADRRMNERPPAAGKPQADRRMNERLPAAGKPQADRHMNERPPVPGKLPAIPKMPRKIEVSVPISVKDFSQVIGVRANLIMQKILESSKNNRITLNESLDETMVEWLGLEFGKEIQIKKGENVEEAILKEIQKEDKPQDLIARGPVVTFMGHVDHGKTSLLDRIRQTNIAAHEAGGITQHIGAHKVKTQSHEIVFLDTPGHEAFTHMRSRGAQLTDIVVLVVAADDGVMPQTIEAISHAKAANVPVVVALNKIDKPTARPETVIQQLTKYNLIPEKWGGDTGFFEVSALTGQGMPELLEYLGLMGEVMELKANPKRKAMGVVVESKIMEGKGVVTTLLVQNGTLHRGDNILCGTSYGRVRDITDHLGKNQHEAGPSTPVEISGLSELPEAGDKFYVVDDPSLARTIAEDRKKKLREKQLAKGVKKITIEDIMKQIQKAETPELLVILKTDVHGSLEAICPKLESFSADKVKLKVLHAAVGGINERDIQLADASQAIVIGFNVTANKMAREMAENKKIQIRYYSIIYQMFEDIKNIMQGLLVPESKEETTGHATVRKVINLSKSGKVAGCYITDGVVERSSHIRISRDGVVINKDKPLAIASLKHFKEDVGKVKEGFECGIKLDGFDDIKEGDELEAFKMVSVAQKLE